MAVHTCGVCGQDADFVPIYLAAKIAAVSRSTMYYWIEKKWVHWCELASGRKIICRNSLVRDLPKKPEPVPGSSAASRPVQQQRSSRPART